MLKKKRTLILILIAMPLLFISVRSLLQNPGIYSSTLGAISDNYELESSKYNARINKVEKPFITINSNNIYNWDGAFYSVIRDSLYSHTDIHKDRLAFFPLYPILLKTLPRRSAIVFAFNYLLFAIGLLLIAMFTFNKGRFNYYIIVLGLLLPAVINFYIPYAEPLLMLSIGIALLGMQRGKYWLYFIGTAAFSMTRPTVLVFAFALILTDVSYLLRHRNIKFFVKELFFKMLPVAVGFLVVIFIQYLYTGSFTAYFDALDIWQVESGFFGNEINDWSVEGFGMNTFAIFFVMIPSLLFACIWIIRNLLNKEKQSPSSAFEKDTTFAKDYMFMLSVFFMVGNILMLLLASGGALNGYARYTMAVPFFYIILFQLPERLSNVSLKTKMGGLLLCFTLMALFLNLVNYSGDLFRFEYSGLYILLALLIFLIAEAYLPQKLKIVILLIMMLPCIVWQTYLFNMYLSNAWIFT